VEAKDKLIVADGLAAGDEGRRLQQTGSRHV
jgi:hypothetical protein